jgi:hypothetical protein
MLMVRSCLIGLALAALVCPAEAYYIDWEGDCLPEEGGWTRVWGDWSGPYHGTGAVRTIEDGVMTMDSLYDPGVCDFAQLRMAVNPAPGEQFVMEWRLAIDQTTGPDQGAGVCSDDHWVLAFAWVQDALINPFDPGLNVPVSSGEFHDYRVISWNMREYDLLVDGVLAYHGFFDYGGDSSSVGWGDGGQGEASLARWDYFRVYTTPEPGGLALCGAVFVWLARRRHSP